jgi:hypothetical protein
MKRGSLIVATLLLLMFSATGFAQEPDHMFFMPAQAGPPSGGNVFFQKSSNGAPGMVAFGGTEFLMEGRRVKSAPFSAESITETVQTLGDGNRIRNTSSTKIYRDSEGRTRREVGPGAQAMALLPFPGDKASHPEVMISDPVAGVSYVLDIKARRATKLPGSHMFQAGHVTVDTFDYGFGVGQVITRGSGQPGRQVIVRTPGSGEVTTESLGTQTIQGVEAQGRRVTTTIPTGKIGNEQPIVTTDETWYSPKLQRVVLSKRHDPRFGDTTFRLANIDQSEPSPSLFQVPSDFTVTDTKTEMERFRKEWQANGAEMQRFRKEWQGKNAKMQRMLKDMPKVDMEQLRKQLQEQQEQIERMMKELPNGK